MITPPAVPRRVTAIDIARTLAIAAMAIFHLTYDLELFGFVASGTMASPTAVWSARLIAGSFIFISGASLILAHLGGGLTTPRIARRLVMLGLAAMAVTIGTYVAMGQVYVRFGILHNLFVASILGLLFLNIPYWFTGLLGAGLALLPLTGAWPLFHATHWLWLGITREPIPMMVDYVPVLPWFGIFLLGMATAHLLAHIGAWHRIAAAVPANKPVTKRIAWPGTHSLAIYLIHQPVLFGAVYLARAVLG